MQVEIQSFLVNIVKNYNYNQLTAHLGLLHLMIFAFRQQRYNGDLCLIAIITQHDKKHQCGSTGPNKDSSWSRVH